MKLLRQSTEQVVQFGPFVDIGDGVTLETGLATAMDNATTGIRVSKDGAAYADRNSATVPSYDAMGDYRITLSTTDTNTVGILKMIFEEAATCLPVWQEFMVIDANAYDALTGADTLDVNVIEWLGTAAATPTTAGVPEVDVTFVSGAAEDIATETKQNTAQTDLDTITGSDGATLATAQALYAPAKAGDAMALSAGAVTNASLAGNMEIVFETDFATNYNATRNAWATNVQDFVGTSAADPFNGQVVAASVTGAVGSVTGHTPQTGDTYALANGATGFAAIDTVVDAILVDTGTDIPARFDGIEGGTFSSATDSLEAIRDRGDAAWTTGGGGSLTQNLSMTPLFPTMVDLADTATYRLGIQVYNSLDDLPTTAEITPGTISIDRKAYGGTSWTSVVSNAALSESAGQVYYDEVFDTATGYAAGDYLRITIKSLSVTADTNTMELADATGIIFYSNIPGSIESDGSGFTAIPWNASWDAEVQSEAADAITAAALATAASLATAQTDLDTITGSDGVTLATAQGNYAPATAAALATVDTEVGALQTDLDNATDGLGALKTLIDAIQVEVEKLTTTAHTEPTGVPAANEAPIDKLGYLFMALRNQVDVTATKKTFYDDSGTAEWEKDLSDNGTTYSESEGNAI